ncbi:MAG: hypothetical protein K2P81_00035 [Bacteriovoracaceae bacterium]|nr:hypothetical protein [Bacteriovoracaceae bacterium]
MQKSKQSRKKLALKIFLAALSFNSFLLILCWPSDPEVNVSQAIPENHIEIKISGVLHTAFEKNKKIILSKKSGKPIATAILSKLENEQIFLWLPEKTYREHHQSLIHEEWSVIPYIAGIEAIQEKKEGRNYEIAY